MPPLLTEGSRRVLALADRLAQSAGLSHCGPLQLLQALWLDESRAHEILQAQGLDTHLMHQRFQLPAAPPPHGPDTPSLPLADDLQRVLLEARQIVTGLGRHVEIATEHLLQALLAVRSPLQAELIRQGISASPPGADTPSPDHTQAPLPTDITLLTDRGPATDHAGLYRILDAAANRASEGLRVVEDYLRFVLNDRHLTEQLKACRHSLAQALQLLPTPALLACRETLTDVGTTLHTRHELHRHSLLQVVRADFKRVQEACRSLEEFGKRVSPEFSSAAGQLRYQVYTLERAVFLSAHSADRLAHCDLYLLLTESLCPHGSGPVLRAALRGGVKVVQVREKHMPDRALLTHARRVREKTAEAGALLIMNDRPDLAVLCDADGVHVGQTELPVAEVRRIVGPDRLIGVSTRNLDQARQAVLDGADYIGLGPVFNTTTKDFAKLAGLEYIAGATAEITLPGYCIGGINLENLDHVLKAGGRRIAVSGAICTAPDPEHAARELLTKIRAPHPAK